mmetsp:Transcript_19517/g.54359  ORF Transcript_19517/g.54359 Transcript_19517/m.54359 type:complete len:554 (-) Transcript_19517:99-1760(-)
MNVPFPLLLLLTQSWEVIAQSSYPAIGMTIESPKEDLIVYECDFKSSEVNETRIKISWSANLYDPDPSSSECLSVVVLPVVNGEDHALSLDTEMYICTSSSITSFEFQISVRFRGCSVQAPYVVGENKLTLYLLDAFGGDLSNTSSSFYLEPSRKTNNSSQQAVDLAILCAASSNHYLSLTQLLSSISTVIEIAASNFPKYRFHVVIYDLGLSLAQHNILAASCSTASQQWPSCELRTFDFDEHPLHVALERDCLAWKPLIISSVLRDFPAVLYLDAGCIFQGSLDEVLSLLYCEGGSEPPVLSDGGVGGNATTASGDELERRQQHAGTHAAAGKCDGLMTIYAGPFMSLKDLTHPAMLRWFGVTDDIGQWTQMATGAVAVARAHRGHLTVVPRWVQCALDEACICPAGSSRRNHRQDQSAWSLIIHMAGLRGVPVPGRAQHPFSGSVFQIAPAKLGVNLRDDGRLMKCPAAGVLVHNDIDFDVRLIFPTNGTTFVFQPATGSGNGGLGSVHPAQGLDVRWMPRSKQIHVFAPRGSSGSALSTESACREARHS